AAECAGLPHGHTAHEVRLFAEAQPVLQRPRGAGEIRIHGQKQHVHECTFNQAAKRRRSDDPAARSTRTSVASSAGSVSRCVNSALNCLLGMLVRLNGVSRSCSITYAT